jgi:hypothetical protein
MPESKDPENVSVSMLFQGISREIFVKSVLINVFICGQIFFVARNENLSSVKTDN